MNALSFGILSAARREFMPPSGIVHWSSAKSIALALNDPVATLDDLVGSNDWTRVGTSSDLVFKPTGANGRPGIFFNAIDDEMEVTSNIVTGRPRTVFTVTAAASGIGGTPLSFRLSGYAYMCREFSATTIGGDALATNQTIAVNLATAWQSLHVTTWMQDSSGNTRYFVNDTEYAVSGNPPVAENGSTGAVLGAAATTPHSQYFGGIFGEEQVYDRELTDNERAYVRSNLYYGWAITP